MTKQLKLKPRGRPWPKGVSGNPAGRPPGSRHKTTLMILEGARLAEEELSRPLLLDESRPYESWDGYYFQNGLRFDKRSLEAIPTDGPRPVQPERLDPRERRTPILWKGKDLYLQNGWAFDQATWLAVKL